MKNNCGERNRNGTIERAEQGNDGNLLQLHSAVAQQKGAGVQDSDGRALHYRATVGKPNRSASKQENGENENHSRCSDQPNRGERPSGGNNADSEQPKQYAEASASEQCGRKPRGPRSASSASHRSRLFGPGYEDYAENRYGNAENAVWR